MLQQLVEVVEEPENSTLFIDNFLCRKYFTLFMEQPVEVSNGSNDLRASAHKYGPNNGTSRKIDFAQILPIDWPKLVKKRTIVCFR